MLEMLGLLGFGLAVGFYGTLVGIGGGPLLVPMLALCYSLPPATTVATSLSVIFLNALSGSFAYYEQKRIDLVSGTLFGLATIPASVAAYFLLADVSHHMFNVVFAVFLLCISAYVLLGGGRPPDDLEPESVHVGILGPTRLRRLVDSTGRTFTFTVDEPLGAVINVALGFVTTLLGIGGGMLQVPLLVFGLRLPVHVATATAHYITAINAGFTLIPLLFFGHADPRLTLWLGCGAVIGARLGARVSIRVRDATLMRLLTVVFVVSALWMLRD